MKIESLTIKNGQILKLSKISIFVGANNSGKSQTLRDIKDYLEKGKLAKPIIVQKISFNSPENYEEIFENLEVKDSKINLEHQTVTGIKSNLLEEENFEFHSASFRQHFEQVNSYEFTLGKLSKFRVAYLDSSTRLNLVKTTESFNTHENNPKNLLQSLFVEKENEALLQTAFKDAFNMEIKLDYSELVKLSLRVAKKLPQIPKDAQEAYLITNKLAKIDEQWDGFRSFVGIILSLLHTKNRIILLDEPEAFLHPAQARFLGKWIMDNSDKFKGQLLISTHNSNFLNGVLSSDKDVDIYRLNRIEENTHYNLISAETNNKLSKSPILSSQRVLEAIFHKGVVICEADADRAIYQSISVVELNNQEILFIHAHNKQALKDVAKLFVDAKIPTAVIADIDILNDENEFQKIIEVLSENKINQELLDKRTIIASSVNQVGDSEILQNILTECKEFVEQLEEKKHTLDGAKGAYNRIEKIFTKWRDPKIKGILWFKEEIRPIVIDLINQSKAFNLFIVPVGELECWIDLGVKKSKWTIPALEKIYAKKSPENLINFIKEILAKFD